MISSSCLSDLSNTRTAVNAPAARVFPSHMVALACALEWLLPGAGYLLLGRFGRALVAFGSVTLLFGWGVHLHGQLDRFVPNQVLASLAAFAQMGVGLGYFVVAGSEDLLHGLGDPTAATSEMGVTLLRAAGLGGYLLLLDVYDIATGRKD